MIVERIVNPNGACEAMSNIVHVNFQHRCRVERSTDLDFELFLQMLRDQGLDEDDVLEVTDAVQDAEYYETVDDDIKTIADAWLYGHPETIV